MFEKNRHDRYNVSTISGDGFHGPIRADNPDGLPLILIKGIIDEKGMNFPEIFEYVITGLQPMTIISTQPHHRM
jgi:hypothetical protein